MASATSTCIKALQVSKASSSRSFTSYISACTVANAHHCVGAGKTGRPSHLSKAEQQRQWRQRKQKRPRGRRRRKKEERKKRRRLEQERRRRRKEMQRLKKKFMGMGRSRGKCRLEFG